MPKTSRTQYVCQQCGRAAPKPLGRCPQCGAWNSMVAEAVVPSSPRATGKPKARSAPKKLSEVTPGAGDRLALAIGEFSRVLGGGIVPGSVVLVGGDPGIGKSTLLLQMALSVAEGRTVLYVSGEESEAQIKSRATRLLAGGGRNLPEGLYLVTETDLEAILAHVDTLAPDLAVVDSIQTVYLPGLKVPQARFLKCASVLRSCRGWPSQRGWRYSWWGMSRRRGRSQDRGYWSTSSTPYSTWRGTHSTPIVCFDR